jgi:hypothetical protein
MADILDGTNLDLSVLTFTKPKLHGSGSKVLNMINKNTKESIIMTTPLMFSWDAQESKDANGNPTGNWTLSLQFPNGDYPSLEADLFLKNLRSLDNAIKENAVKNSMEWFGQDVDSVNFMNMLFNPMLKHPKKEKGSNQVDTSKPPTLTVKIPCWKGVWQSEIYDEEGNPLYIKGMPTSPLEFLSRGNKMCLIQCAGIWFANGKASICWNLKQAVVHKRKESSVPVGVCFLKPKASDIAQLKKSADEDDHIPVLETVPGTMVDDSDDEHEEEEPVIAKVEKPVVAKVVEKVEVVVEKVEEVAKVEPKKVIKKIIKK